MVRIHRLVPCVVVAACVSPMQDGETFDVLANSGPVITSVTTEDGFTQVRANQTVRLVITGKRLQHTTSVSIGLFFSTITSVSPHEVRVTSETDGFTPIGPVEVALTSAQGTTVAPGAIEMTPFVVSPAAVTGHGTFQSPINFCDPQLVHSLDITVLLLAGTHHCDHPVGISGPSAVLGDPNGGTIIEGPGSGEFGLVISSGTGPAAIRDITYVASSTVPDAGGIFVTGPAAIERYHYEGEGTGADLTGGTISESTIRHCGTGDGIRVDVGRSLQTFGGIIMRDVVIEDCRGGLVLDGADGTAILTEVASCQFIDNEFGLQIARGEASIHHTVIRDDESTPRESLSGIVHVGDGLGVSDVEITGQANVGIAMSHRSSFDHGSLFVDLVSITGGRIGISFSGMDNTMFLSNATIVDQTEASLKISSDDSGINLGSSSIPGNNALSVLSGFAIDDSRSFTDSVTRYIRAFGTTLNGVNFAGQQIDGPAELAPHYRILSSQAGIQF